MKPSRHIIVSSFAGITIWVLARDVYAAAICLVCGVLPDIDHILEFIIHKGTGKLSIVKVYEMFSKLERTKGKAHLKKLYLVFHCWEFTAALWLAAIFTKNLYIVAAAVGYTLHLVTDRRWNNMPKGFYFLSWRIWKKFSTKTMFNLHS